MHFQDEYYWYGEHRVPNQSNSIGVSVYRSSDLVNWKFEGLALKRGGHTDTGPDMVLERPKVLHNLQTGNFVMWMHIDSPDYVWARVGVAVSKTPLGPFSFERSFRPHDQESRDFTVWQDDEDPNKAAYIAYSSEDNMTMHIDRLTSDYRSVSSRDPCRAFVQQKREAPAFFKHKEIFFMATSGCSGWKPNRLKVFWSREPLGEWKSLGDPCVGSPDQNKTFGSQPNFVLAVPRHAGCYVFMADRWDQTKIGETNTEIHASRYVWLPLWLQELPEGTGDHPVKLEICWHDVWSFQSMEEERNEALNQAAQQGHLQDVRALLAAGASPEFRGLRGWTAIMFAASQGRADIAQLLVDGQADVNARCETGSTVLMHAAWAGKLEVVRYLVSAGASRDAEDNEGRTAAMTAADRGHEAIVQALD